MWDFNDLLERICSSDEDDAPPILREFDRIAETGDDAAAVARAQFGFVRRQIATNPRAFFRELRDHRPIMRAGPVWLVSRYRDVEEILHWETVFSVKSYLPRMMGVIGPFVFSQDITPLYDHDISAMRLVVRRDDLGRVHDIVSTHAAGIVDKLAGGGTFDIVQPLTRTVPLRVAAEYYGFAAPDDATMQRWARTCFHEFFVNLDNNPDIRAAAVASGEAMRAWLTDLIAARRNESAGTDDVLGRLLAQQCAGPDIGCDDEGVVRTMMGLVVGMVETTSQAAVQALLVLAARPEGLAAAAAAARSNDDDLLADLVFEALRFRPVNPLVVRVMNEDYRPGAGEPYAQVIPQDAVVFALTWSAMFDDRVLDAPTAFHPGRPDSHYLHFAAGRHACFGRYISRVQVTQILKPLLAREGFRLAGAPVYAGPFPETLEVAVGG